jgi:hypothetical protein
MPQLVVPNAAILRLIWSVGGVPSAVNVLGVVNGANVAINQALANTLGTAIKSAMTSTGIVGAIHTSVSLSSVGIRDIRTPNQPEYVDTGAAVVGTGTGDLLPLQTALCITLRTALAGRSYRGRVYLFGYAESVNDANGRIVSSATSVSFVTAIKSALASSSLDLGIISRPAPTLPIPRAGGVTAVTSIVARDTIWDTQRRRAVAGI